MQQNKKSSPSNDLHGCHSSSESCHCQGPTQIDLGEPLTEVEASDTKISRRKALSNMVKGAVIGASVLQAGCSPGTKDQAAVTKLHWDEYFKKNFRLMTDKEKMATADRLQKLSKADNRKETNISTKPAIPGVLYGYAFNISKCQGYMDCVTACAKENNLDKQSKMHYIRIFEMKNGNMNIEEGNSEFSHEVPAAGHFYMGTQCFQCENPPCVKVCPVGATWKEPDGIVVIDYDWCIGCRYCQSACPYLARRFNWRAPDLPPAKETTEQHYLGNRPRKKGVMEKCTFCIQRTREGKLPACAEACPTGARVFGNLLDPKSEIRYVLANKKVFRLKEELGTEPKFWYFMD